MSAPKGYSVIQITLHWTIAALVMLQLFVNEGMQKAFNAQLEDLAIGPVPDAVLHIVVGLTILVLAALRLAIRLRRGVPDPHRTGYPLLLWLGLSTHVLLYGFIFLMPLTGALAWFFRWEWSAELHEIGRFLLVPAIMLHVVGALVEHFVFRNDSLKRMLGATGD